MADGILDEALERLRDTGPERNGWLSNHAPMAAEALTRHGHADQVHRWLDSYDHLLEERPRGINPIPRDQWRDPLGDPVRTGDWIRYFERELADSPWREVLELWWPRLLPGIAAGATHGVIRVGHAVRALLDVETAPRILELAHGLAYWAARWQPLALPAAGPYRTTDPRAALDAVSRVPDQRFGIRHRLAQLAALDSWPAVPGSWADASGSRAEVSGSLPAAPGSWRDAYGSLTAAPDSWRDAYGSLTAAPGSWATVHGEMILVPARPTAASPTPVGGQEGSSRVRHSGDVVHRQGAVGTTGTEEEPGRQGTARVEDRLGTASVQDRPGRPGTSSVGERGGGLGTAGVGERRGGLGTAGVEERLGAIVDAAVGRFFTHGYGAPVMLVHAATAPTAVLRALPALPGRLWAPSLEAAWAATTAVTAAYSPAGPRPVETLRGDPMEAAAGTADPHAIKFVDAALDVLNRTGDHTILGRAVAAVMLIAAD
ncbi:hypothetical protein Acsp02_90960 [Actinoplanes sp. NBRC 103695]|nr:questin oxidase family protein [Actinoplanes sp. NBRC 103695]GLZ01845.1 hypothetical protein Acsp02_90960 [Actinoplanes sp. NBRC 103695]